MAGETAQITEKHGPPCDECRGGQHCEALEEADEQADPGLAQKVEALLGCRSFLWDVLLEGEWSGCSRPLIRSLVRTYGAESVKKSFEGR